MQATKINPAPSKTIWMYVGIKLMIKKIFINIFKKEGAG